MLIKSLSTIQCCVDACRIANAAVLYLLRDDLSAVYFIGYSVRRNSPTKQHQPRLGKARKKEGVFPVTC